jgi:hypothetical protein
MIHPANEPFDRLAETIRSVRAWTDAMLAIQSLDFGDRSLLKKLRKYADHCERKPANWKNAAAATRIRKKLDNFWGLLLNDVIIKQQRTKK